MLFSVDTDNAKQGEAVRRYLTRHSFTVSLDDPFAPEFFFNPADLKQWRIAFEIAVIPLNKLVAKYRRMSVKRTKPDTFFDADPKPPVWSCQELLRAEAAGGIQ
jgi:hypothetical protein